MIRNNLFLETIDDSVGQKNSVYNIIFFWVITIVDKQENYGLLSIYNVRKAWKSTLSDFCFMNHLLIRNNISSQLFQSIQCYSFFRSILSSFLTKQTYRLLKRIYNIFIAVFRQQYFYCRKQVPTNNKYVIDFLWELS